MNMEDSVPIVNNVKDQEYVYMDAINHFVKNVVDPTFVYMERLKDNVKNVAVRVH